MGFVLNFITNANGIYSFIEGDFVVPTCFNTQVLATEAVLRFARVFRKGFFFRFKSKQADGLLFFLMGKQKLYLREC